MQDSEAVVAAGPPRSLGVESGSRVRFGEAPKPEGAWAGTRTLWIDEAPTFALSYWCGTCPFLFERLEGGGANLSLRDLSKQLAVGLDELDEDVIARFATLLPLGTYLPLLLRVQPQLVRSGEGGDYFADEQMKTWTQGWQAHDPQTAYYRTYEAPVEAEAHLFEFVVPMVPPTWNEPGRAGEHRARLARSERPTAVAVATLDVSQPAMSDESDDYFAHWGLTHFLLDGHHKMEAAAEATRPLRLLSLVSLDSSLAKDEQVLRLPELRARPRARRESK